MICKLLNCTFGFTSRFTESNRSKIRTGLYFILFFVALLYSASILNGVHLLMKCAVGAGLMGLIILFTVNGTVHRVKWNKPIAAMWFGMGLLQLASGCFVSMEYLPMALIWLVAFPVLFFVWNNRKDYITLFKEIALAGNACFLFLGITSILFYPMNVHQYGGFVNNPNGMGQWVTFAFPLIVFLHYQEKGSQIKKWLYRAELALVLLLCFVSKGRTALIAVGMMLLVLVVLRLVSSKNKFTYYAKQGVKFLLCAALVWVVCMTVNLVPQMLVNAPPGTNMPPEIPTINQENPNFTGTPTINQENPSPSRPQSGIGGLLSDFIDRILGTDKSGNSLNDYSSGRIGIWIGALKSANALGHPSSEHIITDRNGDIGNNVHNTLLQWCYNNGLFASLLFAIIAVWSMLVFLKRSLRKGNLFGIHSYMLIIQLGFACTAMFASLNLPFLYLIEFLYYISFAILFDREAKTE